MALRRPQRLDFMGTRAFRHGVPWAPGDLYYQLMGMTWPAFVAVYAAVFLLINLGFGTIYASLPGAIDHMRAGSLADGFFFSVETLATVGYGNMAPATHLGHVVATAEIMIGLFLTATITGLIFQRFARPRDSLLFSRVLVVARVGEQRLAMIRLAGTRARPLADVVAQLGVLETVTLPTGRQYRRSAPLPLINDRNAMMALAWTIVHVIDDASPLAAVIDGDEPLRITVTVRALDTLLSSSAFGGHVYQRGDIRIDDEFVDIVETRDDGSLHVDLGRLHETRPAPPATVGDDMPS